jgi:hypothetical protein
MIAIVSTSTGSGETARNHNPVPIPIHRFPLPLQPDRFIGKPSSSHNTATIRFHAIGRLVTTLALSSSSSPQPDHSLLHHIRNQCPQFVDPHLHHDEVLGRSLLLLLGCRGIPSSSSSSQAIESRRTRRRRCRRQPAQERIERFGRGGADSRAHVLRLLWMVRHLVEGDLVLVLVGMWVRVRVHCLRLVHSLPRRMIQLSWREVLRSAGRWSLDGGVLLLRLRVASSELVARWLWLRLLVLLLLGLRLAGCALLVRRGAILLSFLDHGRYHCSRDAELVAVAVEDYGGVGRREMAALAAVVHESAAGRFGDGAAVVCVVLVAEGGGDEGGAEGLLVLVLLMLMLLDGLKVRRRLDRVEIWGVDVRCEVGRQGRVKWVCWRT